MNLTDKETKAILAIANSGCESIGADSFEELFNDNMTWFNREELSESCGFSKHEAAGIMSSLEAKGLAQNHDPGAHCSWVLTDKGIQAAIDNV